MQKDEGNACFVECIPTTRPTRTRDNRQSNKIHQHTTQKGMSTACASSGSQHQMQVSKLESVMLDGVYHNCRFSHPPCMHGDTMLQRVGTTTVPWMPPPANTHVDSARHQKWRLLPPFCLPNHKISIVCRSASTPANSFISTIPIHKNLPAMASIAAPSSLATFSYAHASSSRVPHVTLAPVHGSKGRLAVAAVHGDGVWTYDVGRAFALRRPSVC